MVFEELKQRLKAQAAKLKRYEEIKHSTDKTEYLNQTKFKKGRLLKNWGDWVIEKDNDTTPDKFQEAE